MGLSSIWLQSLHVRRIGPPSMRYNSRYLMIIDGGTRHILFLQLVAESFPHPVDIFAKVGVLY